MDRLQDSGLRNGQVPMEGVRMKRLCQPNKGRVHKNNLEGGPNAVAMHIADSRTGRKRCNLCKRLPVQQAS
eukprot:1161852-Pelagomonas_calceolata.AAC.5